MTEAEAVAMAYHPKTLKWLSVVQIIIGPICLIFGIVDLILPSYYTSIIGFGVWIGLWILTTGLLGFFGSRDPRAPSKCLMATFMSFSIIACVMSCVMIVPYSMTLAWSRFFDCNRRRQCPHLSVAVILLIIPIVEFGISLTSSILCCMAPSQVCACCTGSGQTVPQQVVYLQPEAGHTHPGGVVFLSSGASGSVMLPPGQIMVPQPGQTHKEQDLPPAYSEKP